MSIPKLVTKEIANERILVVMTVENIHWYQAPCVEETMRPLFTQSLTHGGIEIPEEFLPAEGESRIVELIVDTNLDDLDRVKLVDSAHRYLQPFRRLRTLWALQKEYADSQIFRLPRVYRPNIASVLHTTLAENHLATIEFLQTKGLLISHMTTSTQILCSTNSCSGARLFVFPCGKSQERHVLVDSGAIIFMRIVELDLNDDPSLSEVKSPSPSPMIEETLSYLVENEILRDSSVPIESPSTIVRDGLEAFKLEDCLAWAYVTTLPMLRSEHVESTSHVSDKKNVRGCTRRIKQLFSRLVWFGKNHSSIKRRHYKHLSTQHWNRYRVGGRLLEIYDVLGPSRDFLRNHAVLSLLRNMTIVLAIVTLVAVLLVSIQGVRQLRTLNALDKQRINVESRISSLQADLYATHKTPFLLAETLERNQNFSESFKATPKSVLTLIASLLKEFPTLNLQSLSWSLLPQNTEYETVVADVRRSASRSLFVTDISSEERLSVTVAGLISAAESLRDKQHLLEAFMRQLAKHPLVINLAVLESPVSSAGSSESLTSNEDYFKVKFSAKIP